MTTEAIDPRSLSLDELRALRARLQSDDDAVSYVRRLTQVRLDLARAELAHRADGDDLSITKELPAILGSHLVGGAARPPRPTDDLSGHPLAVALEDLCRDKGSADLTSLTLEELQDYVLALHEFEQARSAERKDLFTRIDALSAELVRRYRDGEADVDGLLGDD